MDKNEIVIFETEDRSVTLAVAIENETVWLKRTQDELDSKQVLSVIEKYNTALELLDAYDHQTMIRSKVA